MQFVNGFGVFMSALCQASCHLASQMCAATGGQRASFNQANGMSEIEGKVDEGRSERVRATSEFQSSEWGERDRR